MKKSDEFGWVSQRSAAQWCDVSQQYVNSLTRSGKLKTKADGRVYMADVVDYAVISKARQTKPRAEFEAWLKKFKEARYLERVEATLERILAKMPRKQAEALIGPELCAKLLPEVDESPRPFDNSIEAEAGKR